ncbi:histidine kinase [Bacillus shivajii]|uniref:GAF domain-containing sensor histidine kinase n=1 Tax=Bacillus shivajii TaxID=1983719 RepID=UPI001CFC41DC|nr:histidine kinase [Bacillus shivajii]UCZ52427.1 histidine kinase [Bacillus shivajii]
MHAITKEKQANIFMTVVSIFGWLFVLSQFFFIEGIEYFSILAILLIFLFFTERYPLPVWKGHSSLSFPIIFSIDLVYGLPILTVAYAFIVLLVNIVQKRPIRILFFNPAQLVISFACAKGISSFLFSFTDQFQYSFIFLSMEIGVFIILYFIINNLLVDVVLWLRPQPYSFSLWKQKMTSELFNACFSFMYTFLMLFLGSQERSHLDIFATFFFFSPLVGVSLLSSSVVKLKREKQRLKTLFSFTQQLNQSLPSKNWLLHLAEDLSELLHYQGAMILSKESGEWKIEFADGLISVENIVEVEENECFHELTLIHNRTKEVSPLDPYFYDTIKAMIYAPLKLDGEIIGVIAVGRTRTHSFTDEDVQSVATIANQLAVAIKTRTLINEKEEKKVLEERNRIAREIHDGVAQTLAAAVMNLETAQKKYYRNQEGSFFLVSDSLSELRHSLTEIRESIYALRPKPTEYVGLEQAIRKRCEILKKQQPFKVNFEVRGSPYVLPSSVEKMMFETFQESIQNTIKHAKPSNVVVLLSYQKKHVLLKMKDDGIGFSLYDAIVKAQSNAHFGLISMNDEAEKMDASLQIDSKEREGTEITLTIPIEKIEKEDEDD